VAKTDKPAAGKPAGGEPSDGKSDRTINIVLVCAVVAAALVGGYFYFVRGASQNDPNAPKKDPDLAELMTPPAGLQDVSIGSQDAPNVIVEYASMTCPHCAQFDKVVFPELKTKYIDTGKVRLIFREFPLDGLAARASMLARCAGPDRYFAMIDVMFQTQPTWVVEGPEALDHLLQLARQAGFWQQALAGAPPLLQLPTDRPRPALQSYRGSRWTRILSRELSTRLREFSRAEGCTLFMTLLSSFYVLLSRYSGQDDIVVGTPVAGRRRTELEPLIGFFANTLLMRGDLSGDPPFRELLAASRQRPGRGPGEPLLMIPPRA